MRKVILEILGVELFLIQAILAYKGRPFLQPERNIFHHRLLEAAKLEALLILLCKVRPSNCLVKNVIPVDEGMILFHQSQVFLVTRKLEVSA